MQLPCYLYCSRSSSHLQVPSGNDRRSISVLSTEYDSACLISSVEFCKMPLVFSVVSGCRSDSECPSDKACLNGQCQNPCRVPNDPCGDQAVCEAILHRPVCKCPIGWAGNPHIECFTCESILCLRLLHSRFSKYYFLDECQVNADCPLDKACVSNKCINPCRQTSCGDRAECKVDYHQPRCVCPPGLQGNPIVKCVAVECHNDNDCASDEKCNPLTNKCFPVCQAERCGADEAICSGVDHRKVCSCPPPLLGNGNVYCGLKRKMIL